MSDYLFCVSQARRPGVIRIMSARENPRLETAESRSLRRELGDVVIEWSLPVVDRALSEAALRQALRSCRDRSDKECFACDPMHARGEAVKLTTLREDPRKRRKPSLLRRLIRAA